MTTDESDSTADDTADDTTDAATGSSFQQLTGRVVRATEQLIRVAEIAAAAVFAILFAIGVFDLARQIWQGILSGRIAKPLVVIGFLDTGLLLLIIVEVYQTVIAYMRGNETREIVRLVIYAGVIAMVRKAIIFRTGSYASTQDALFAAGSYTVLILGLIGLLLVERLYE